MFDLPISSSYRVAELYQLSDRLNLKEKKKEKETLRITTIKGPCSALRMHIRLAIRHQKLRAFSTF